MIYVDRKKEELDFDGSAGVMVCEIAMMIIRIAKILNECYPEKSERQHYSEIVEALGKMYVCNNEKREDKESV